MRGRLRGQLLGPRGRAVCRVGRRATRRRPSRRRSASPCWWWPGACTTCWSTSRRCSCGAGSATSTRRRHRSRLLGTRERRLTLGRYCGMGVPRCCWRRRGAGSSEWRTSARRWSCRPAAGAVLMLLAVVPILFMSSRQSSPSALPRVGWRVFWAPLADRAYRRFIAYHAWLAFANGAHRDRGRHLPARVGDLVLRAPDLGLLDVAGSGGALAPWCGRLVERIGAKRVMLPAQLLVATGPLCFYFADAAYWYWIAAAYVVWIGFVALNVSIDSLKIGLADPNEQHAVPRDARRGEPADQRRDRRGRRACSTRRSPRATTGRMADLRGACS